MVTCTRCGTVADGSKPYCINCGAPLPSAEAPEQPARDAYAAPQPCPVPPDARPPRGARFAPMTVGGYIGTFLLLCLPVANLVLLIVWACGGCVNENKRNLARALLILYGICVILSLILIALLGGFSQVTDIISEAEVSALCRLM